MESSLEQIIVLLLNHMSINKRKPDWLEKCNLAHNGIEKMGVNDKIVLNENSVSWVLCKKTNSYAFPTFGRSV